MTASKQPWATTFGLALYDHTSEADGAMLTELVQPGLRRNPRRAHLLVSTVLGKHIAVDPATIRTCGRRLGALVGGRVDGKTDVLGIAETATSLGHCVADYLGAEVYLHSTRRHAQPARVYAEFQEGHSHATDHFLQPSTAVLFSQFRPLIIVDDEISTGNTALATIRALGRLHTRPHYIVASLVDVRTDEDRYNCAVTAAALNVSVDFVSLATGEVIVPAGLTAEVCALPSPKLCRGQTPAQRTWRQLQLDWPATVPEGGRHGFLNTDRHAFAVAVDAAAGQLGAYLDRDRPLLVVGHEELMYLPLCIAESLAQQGINTRFQSTTRSPAYVADRPGYPLRTGFEFPASEPGEPSPRFLYNGWPAQDHTQPTQLLLIVDAIAAGAALITDGGIVAVLSAAGYDVTIAVVAGPDIDTLARMRDVR
jgi:adenine/guanine phosphoribosyltransferase-like PRPP-binding protein